jgi:broad specificity phosphatase PhoE
MDFKEEGIVETIKRVMLPIWNTYSFFTTYANIDNWEHDSTEVWFTRHGETTANVAATMSDGTDNPELTEKGREQSKNAGKILKDEGKNFDIIIHTSKVRAHDTAHIVGDSLGFTGEYIVDDSFIEQAAGEYARMTHDAMRDTFANQNNINPADVTDAQIRTMYKNNSLENIEKFEKRILS